MNSPRMLASALFMTLGLSSASYAQGYQRLIGESVSYETGNRLWDFCGNRSDGPVPQACWLYIEGASDGIGLQAADGRAPYCLPPAVRADQLADVVRKYLSDHPELRDKGAVWLVRKALAAAFTCATAPTM